MSKTLEDRLRAVEDKLAIFHLIASHPPAADTGSDGYYRDAFTPDAVIDLGGGKAATGNEKIAAVVKTPEHQGAIAAGLCHFAGLPRVELNGDTAVAISYLQVLTPNREAEARGAVRPRPVERLSRPPAGREPLGSQTHGGRLEGDAADLSHAGWQRRGARDAARGGGGSAVALANQRMASRLCAALACCSASANTSTTVVKTAATRASVGQT